MRSFEYYTPTKVIFGKDTHLKIGELLKDYNCHKVLIHYGSESAVKSGLIHEISKCLTEAGIDWKSPGTKAPGSVHPEIHQESPALPFLRLPENVSACKADAS